MGPISSGGIIGPSRFAARSLLSLVPRPIVRAALRYGARRIAVRHPELLERLAPLAGRRVVLDVDEFPETLALTFGAPQAGIAVSLLSRADAAPADAMIGGSLMSFIDLAEGSADADALFFQREIRFAGDTEAVLLLRNALEASEVDVLAAFLPSTRLAQVLRGFLEVARSIGSGAVRGATK